MIEIKKLKEKSNWPVLSPFRPSCWRSTFSTWPSTTRIMTSATVRASSASSLCPLRKAGRSASTLKSCSSPSSPHQCLSLRLKVWQLGVGKDYCVLGSKDKNVNECWFLPIFLFGIDRDHFQLGSLSHLLNAKAGGYQELPEWPETAPDPSVRNVEVKESVRAVETVTYRDTRAPWALQGATKVGGERWVLLPQSSASEGQDCVTRAWHPL